jgi:hypothetical protein
MSSKASAMRQFLPVKSLSGALPLRSIAMNDRGYRMPNIGHYLAVAGVDAPGNSLKLNSATHAL